MKPVKAWAILNSDGRTLALYDYRLPICWLRKVAETEKQDRDRHGKVVRVVIKETK